MTPEEKEAMQMLARLHKEFEKDCARFAQEDRKEVQRKLAPRKATPLTTRRHHGN